MSAHEVEQVPVRGRSGIVAYALVSSEDYEWASQFNWHLSSGYAARSAYSSETKKQTCTFLHREVLERMGRAGDPEHPWTDHVDRNRLNDTRENLREVNYSESATNRGRRRSPRKLCCLPRTCPVCGSVFSPIKAKKVEQLICSNRCQVVYFYNKRHASK